jgi:hypothetical protein
MFTIECVGLIDVESEMSPKTQVGGDLYVYACACMCMYVCMHVCVYAWGGG